MESTHRATSLSSSDHGSSATVLCSAMMESFQLRKTSELRNTSILNTRLLLSTSSVMPRCSAAHLAATTLYGLSVTTMP